MSAGVGIAARPSWVTLWPSGVPCLPDLLFVEEQRSVREACRDAMAALGYKVSVCDSASQALRLLDALAIDIGFVSVKGCREIELVKALKRRRPLLEVVVLSGDSKVESAVEAIKAGAYEFVPKPLSLQRLVGIVERLTEDATFPARYQYNHDSSVPSESFCSLAGHGSAVKALNRMVAKCAHSAHPVLITGEDGTGKELAARAIHEAGTGREHAFVAVDCGSIEAEGLERALFGYAEQDDAGSIRPGLLDRANGGTVFFAEVDKLSIAIQSKLSRVLSTKKVQPVGGAESIPVSVRIIAGSEHNLRDLVSSGAFRRDLYFGLSVLELCMPLLRERLEDIPTLAQHFLDRFSRESGRTLHLSTEALQVLMAHSWPGNTRELEYCVVAACANCSGRVVRPADLPADLMAPRALTQSATLPDIAPLCELEKKAILAAITTAGGDKIKAATQLGIGKTTLYRKLKEYGVRI